MKRNKKSQVTIFIIIAIVLVAAILALFLLKGKTIKELITGSFPNPQEYIEKCVKENTENALAIMMPQGGYISPENYKMYNNIKIAYLCYNQNYYLPCINQEPLYLEHLKQEIKSYINPKIDDCFYSLKQDYEKKNYGVNLDSGDINIELNPKQVNIEINRKLALSKNEETKIYEKFKVKVNSPLYDLAIITQEIVNQEAKFCYFEYLGFQLLYPEYSIEKTDVNGETKIYSIKEKISGKQLNFAVRSCAMPAGM